ncbi:calmodulin-2 [Drosophila elegans]|uniref:calmodulin-2 n=1 Tax=Drosophila elegans TaxID=30023 RepID=UPI001BC85D81|nr:calmodulin-2 [Drosophila elegans]XP_041566636.1 calmodulin-2 [Drosophila elegans]
MSSLTDAQIEEVREAFNLYDTEKTGWVSIKQLGGVMRALGEMLTEAEIYQLANECSSDFGGQVQFKDFLYVMSKRLEEENSLVSLKTAFKIFDRNEVNYFTTAEIRTIMTNLGEKMSDEDLNEMFQDIDLDKDGKICFSEFVTAMRS